MATHPAYKDLKKRFDAWLDNYLNSVRDNQSPDKIFALVTIWMTESYRANEVGDKKNAIHYAKEARTWIDTFIEKLD